MVSRSNPHQKRLINLTFISRFQGNLDYSNFPYFRNIDEMKTVSSTQKKKKGPTFYFRPWRSWKSWDMERDKIVIALFSSPSLAQTNSRLFRRVDLLSLPNRKNSLPFVSSAAALFTLLSCSIVAESKHMIWKLKEEKKAIWKAQCVVREKKFPSVKYVAHILRKIWSIV